MVCVRQRERDREPFFNGGKVLGLGLAPETG
jgi:hypothetical protein